MPNLGQQTGGLDRDDPYRHAAENEAPSAENKPRKGMARVIRDENGKVVDILEYESEEESTTPWGKELNKDDNEPGELHLLVPRLNEGREGEPVKGMWILFIQKLWKKWRQRASRCSGLHPWLSTSGWFSWLKRMGPTTKPWRWTGNETSCKKQKEKSNERACHLLTLESGKPAWQHDRRTLYHRGPGPSTLHITVIALATNPMGNTVSASSHRWAGAGELLEDPLLQYECRYVWPVDM